MCATSKRRLLATLYRNYIRPSQAAQVAWFLGILNMRGHWILATAASRPVPGNRPASPLCWCIPWPAASAGSPFGALRAATPNAALHSSSPPRPCPPRDAPGETIPSTPDKRRCGTVPPSSLSYNRRKGPSLRSPTSKSTQRLPSASLTTAVQTQHSSRLSPRLAPR